MSKPVCVVTGASGYIAGHLIQQLLDQGYPTRGTVRDVKDAKKTAHLRELFPSLQLFEADLLQDGSFDEVMKGAEWVFHTASPFFMNVTDAQKELIEPALNGTINVLKSVDKAATVKRVVLTSSVAAIAKKFADPHVYTEADWNTTSTLEAEPYRLSKRLAEEEAWKISKGKAWDLVTICPSFVMGPVQGPRADATSVKAMAAILNGTHNENGVPSPRFGVVDVRDVARAHVLAAQTPKANGRYIVSSYEAHGQLEWVEILKNSGEFKEFTLPTKENGSAPNPNHFDHKKVKTDLGLEFTKLEKTIVEMAHSLIKFGIVSKA